MAIEEEASEADGPDPLIGETLASRYQIELRLGEGAMGSVYRARHVKVGRPFAVKILHPKLLSDKKVAQRFEREAELAGRLRHPNVIGVVDVGETTEGLRYMVMDYAEGADLASLLADAPMSAPRITNLVRQILEGLFHAHEAGLIHRDFKPENVIVERDAHGHEVPRIVDFGIAILREGGESANAQGRLTTNGLVLGTPHYMAPEQAVADPIDHRIDLFALGIVIYEMLCGKLPFDGTGAEVARANLLLDPPMIAVRVPYLEIDLLLEAFARRLMAKRRESRPPTARAARELLDLIERDRSAAAAVLGVTLESGPRQPTVTQDSAPARLAVNESAPMAAAAVISSAPNGLASPVAPAPAAQAARQRSIPTSVTEPLTYGEGRSKKRLFIVAGIATAIGVAAILIVKSGGSTPPKPNQIAITEGGSGSAAVVLPTGSDTPAVGSDPAPSGSGSDAIEIDAGTTGNTGSSAETGSAAKPGVKIKTKTPKVVKYDPKTDFKWGKGAGSATKAPAVGSAGSAAKPPPEPTVVTTPVLVAMYTSVGRELEALRAKKGEDAISDLQPRYRLVQLNDAMASQAKRDAAHAALVKLLRDIRAASK